MPRRKKWLNNSFLRKQNLQVSTPGGFLFEAIAHFPNFNNSLFDRQFKPQGF
ncbi:MAG: hypothetical protein AB4352_04235 [Hormoscilla sp.]